jgi:hypothetical protein
LSRALIQTLFIAAGRLNGGGENNRGTFRFAMLSFQDDIPEKSAGVLTSGIDPAPGLCFPSFDLTSCCDSGLMAVV